MIGEFVTHDSSPQFGSLNHGVWPDATLLGRPRLDAYGVEADISQPTISAETVENSISGRLVYHSLEVELVLHRGEARLGASLVLVATRRSCDTNGSEERTGGRDDDAAGKRRHSWHAS
jgi:hypothetical protein